MKKNKISFMLMGISGILLIILLSLLININLGEKKDVIYVISKTKSENSTFWHSVERGVNVAADELGVDLVFLGPEREIDFEDQISMVSLGIENDAMAIVLAASDYNILADISENVVDIGIPLITMDSDVNISKDHSFIATNNQEAAFRLGQKLAEDLDGSGLVGIVSHLEGATSAIDREKGFIQGIGLYGDISLIEDIPYSSNDSDIAFLKTVELIEKYPDLKGLFGTNEATLIGISKAVDASGMAGQIHIVGFDISREAARYLEEDVIDAIIVQRPFNMGYLSVREAYRQGRGARDTSFISVDVVMVTKENMFEEETQKFIIPFLE